ncbi:AraC family transcriptional regulator [Bacteroides caecigallinarum]|uniref:helix-turn-helix domain-containing protein n=1 Tax=Bacteroides TaxID=816 RepID=UPI00195BA56E|nr:MULTISPECIES: helix-turn-helix domain-containing protein [Bacteroides]MBM6959904.1 AraC family transcriptional regulator [Bacteroides caecigallinarum]MCR8893347.1 helix-turn-helix domain-containing protein [Bacteroides sp. ET336]MDN0057844.1 helix-turn-helix domain-containing protein [Bacteroides caecigallinarum]
MHIFQLPDDEIFKAGADKNEWLPQGKTMKVDVDTIIFCRKGTAHIEIDLIPYELVANTQLIIIAGSIVHNISNSDDFKISYITFKHEVYDEATAQLEPSFTFFLKEYPCVQLGEKRINKMNYLVEAMKDFYNEKTNCFRVKIFKNNIQSFLLDVYDKTRTLFKIDKSEEVGRREELFIKFIHLIHKYCPQQREVGFYAEKLYITSRYLSSITQNVADKSAKYIIDKHAIQRIKIMLKYSNMSIQDISYELNFPDQSFFSRYFKKHTGMSPLEYRAKP